jgi:hypothetical protein
MPCPQAILSAVTDRHHPRQQLMTPEERDRLARAEQQTGALDERLDRIEIKLDMLVAAAAMGKGAFWLLTKLGGVLVLGAGAIGWAADHFHWWNK